MLGLEFRLVQKFRWNLRDIDETDIESLIPFAFEYSAWEAKQSGGKRRRQLFADQIEL